jgi:hypothetical protein
MWRLFNKRLFLAVALISFSVTIILAITASPLIRIVLGLPLALVLPGFAITGALFPKRELKVAEWVVYTLGLSLACLVLSALLLNLTPWGLRPATWLVLLGVITTAASLIAYRRRQPLPAPNDAGLPESFSLSVRQLVLLALTGAVTLVALAVAFNPSPQQAIQGYTVLWAERGTRDNAGRIVFGVDSKELSPQQYRLDVTANKRLVRQWPVIALAPGETFTASLDLSADIPSDTTLEGALYRLDNPQEAYRQVIVQPNLQ